MTVIKCSNHRKYIPVIRTLIITHFRHPLQRRMDALERKYEHTNEKATVTRIRIMREYEAKHKKFLEASNADTRIKL
uniref:Uncharacterized protein n=1 Tax=viral metagenome TaxID=1070528 RepID=A0A6M3JRI3_9ZZZZ